jgi:hypothetical protein
LVELTTKVRTRAFPIIPLEFCPINSVPTARCQEG